MFFTRFDGTLLDEGHWSSKDIGGNLVDVGYFWILVWA